MEGSVLFLNKAMAMSVAVLLLLDFASAATCQDVGVQFQPCLPEFQLNTTNPSTACCKGLAAVQSYQGEIGINPACNCAKGFILQIPSLIIDFQYSVDVLNSCHVSLGFSLATNSSC